MATFGPGTRLGPYQITAQLGAGGMGEVYKAIDTRLDRAVAIKVLAPGVARNPQVRERFDREARALASLRHPHICPIHDLGSIDDTDYLVIEFLEGETLADRLRAGRLPIDKAIATAAEIADALDAAHRAGIVHRDLKPGNIMLTRRGAILLDFGVAVMRPPPPAAGDSVPTTQLSKLTVEGVVLGTVPYMAPEQIEGRDVDARTDIFAFGAVLFEMITGRRAFTGRTDAALIGAILKDSPPPLSSTAAIGDKLGAVGLHNLEHAVQRCLAKDREDRWQSARDLKLYLRWIADTGSSPAPLTALRADHRREVAAWIVAALALMATVVAWSVFPRPSGTAPVVRFAIAAPEHTTFAPATSVAAPYPVISPDGRQVAFLAQAVAEPVLLWVRALDTLEARPLAGTEGAAFPFWSPDGRQLGFFADGALKTVDALGGASHRVCDAPAGEGGTWNAEGTILFAPGPNAGLHRVAATGGTPTVVTTPAPARGSAPHRWPSFLPDGKHFVFHEGDSIAFGSLDSRDVRIVTTADSQAVYSASGSLLFVRGTTLLAQAFDVTRGDLRGDPRPVAEGIIPATTNAAFSVSHTGVLIYRSGGLAARQLTWLDRRGVTLDTIGGTHDFNGVHLSPDERKVAYHRHDGRPDGDVWVIDLARGTGERFTLRAENLSPLWSPDGTRIVYASNRDSGVNNLWIKPANGSGSDALLLTSGFNKTPRSWSPDGRFIAYVSVGARGDIWILPVTGDRTPFPFAQSPFDERDPMFSPDGRWLAYHSDESGRAEVYVRPFPEGEGRWVISTGGGATPKWRSDGRELFYQVNRELWAVAVTPTAAGLEVGQPERLFDLGAGSAGWAVSRDGQRILVGRGVDDQRSGVVTVIVNWLEALGQ